MPNNFGNDNEVRCSFCGKPQSQAKRLISGNGVYICDECVELCMDIIADEDSLHRGRPQPKNEPRAEMVLPKPQEIKKQLDEYVIGQDEAKMTLAVAVYTTISAFSSAVKTAAWRLQRATCCCLVPPASARHILRRRLQSFWTFRSPLRTQRL